MADFIICENQDLVNVADAIRAKTGSEDSLTLNAMAGAVAGIYPDADDLVGVVAIENGGTGASTAEDALTNLGAAASSHNHSASDITSGTLAVARGGTGVTTDAAIGLKAYPVGSVYISYVSTSPAELFGGTWTAITGRFPYFNAGTSTGGSNTHTLTNTQIPPHKHRLRVGWGADDGNLNVVNVATGAGSNWGSAAAFYDDVITNSSGTVLEAGKSHNNMPAYQTLYAWRRTA